MSRRVRRWAVAALLFSFVALGCSNSDAGAEVRGEVFLDNAPLQKGHIRFVAASGKAGEGDIADGKYAVTGVPVGEVKVEITAPKVVGKRKMYDTADSPVVEDIQELLPARFNVKSELKLTVQSGTQEKRFDVQAK